MVLLVFSREANRTGLDMPGFKKIPNFRFNQAEKSLLPKPVTLSAYCGLWHAKHNLDSHAYKRTCSQIFKTWGPPVPNFEISSFSFLLAITNKRKKMQHSTWVRAKSPLSCRGMGCSRSDDTPMLRLHTAAPSTTTAPSPRQAWISHGKQNIILRFYT